MKLGILADGHPSQGSQKQRNFDFLVRQIKAPPPFFQKLLYRLSV